MMKHLSVVKCFIIHTLHFTNLTLGHFQINLRGGSSREDFFSSEFIEDIIGSVELDGDGIEMSNFGGNEECLVSKYLAFSRVENYCRAFVDGLTCLLSMPVPLPSWDVYLLNLALSSKFVGGVHCAPDIIIHLLVEYGSIPKNIIMWWKWLKNEKI